MANCSDCGTEIDGSLSLCEDCATANGAAEAPNRFILPDLRSDPHLESEEATFQDPGREESAEPTPREDSAGRAGVDRDLNAAELSKIARSRKFVIGLIGYPEAGKTWFLARLKYHYENGCPTSVEAGAGWRPFVGGRPYLPVDPAPENYSMVSRTDWTSDHLFVPAGSLSGEDRASRDKVPASAFYIIDIPGEAFRNAMKVRFRDVRAEKLLSAIQICHALIVLLPAEGMVKANSDPNLKTRRKRITRWEDTKNREVHTDAVGTVPADFDALPTLVARKDAQLAELQQLEARVLRGGRESRQARQACDVARLALESIEREIAELRAWRAAYDSLELDRFTGSILRLSTVLAVLRTDPEDSSSVEKLLNASNSEFAQMADGVSLSKAPLLYVAMSKADTLLSGEELAGREPPDATPEHSLRKARRGLVDGIRNYFAWYKFDFLTAFKGQNDGAESDEIDYELPHYGIDAVIEWIGWARRYAEATGLAGSRRGWRLVLGRLTRWRRMEVELARSGAGARPSDNRLPSWLGHYFGVLTRISTPVILALLGGAVLFAAVLLLWIFDPAVYYGYGEDGAIAIQPRPRYPIELARMAKENDRLASGFESRGVGPWSAVPSTDQMFAVASPQIRYELNVLLRKLATLPTDAPLDKAEGQQLLDELGLIDGEMGRSNAWGRRSVIAFHRGWLYQRMERWPEAASAFQDAREQVLAAHAVGAIQVSRQLGVRAAADHGIGYAYLRAGEPMKAEQYLADAVWLAEDNKPLLQRRGDFAAFYAFDPYKTPASFSLGGAWSDLAAARIRVQATLGPTQQNEQALRDLLGSNRGRTADLANQPELATNLLIAGSRLGVSLDQLKEVGPEAADGSGRSDLEGAARDALRASGDTAGGNNPCEKDDVWCVTGRWRQDFTKGDAAAIRRERASLTDFTPGALQYLDEWRNEVLLTERRRSSSERRGIIAGYGDMYQGIGKLGRWIDNAGGLALSFVWLVLIVGPLTWTVSLIWHARRTYRQLHRPRHYEDRRRSGDIQVPVAARDLD